MIKISRRTFLVATGASVALSALPTIPAYAKDFKEADSLKAEAGKGSLPPVGQRVSDNPLVVTPTSEVGRYGGDWNMALVGGGGLSMLFRYQAYEPLVRYDPAWTKVIPNVAEAFDANADSTVYTIKLRKNMKWSDGQPYTTDDIKFWYDTCLSDKRVAFVGNAHWKQGGKPAKLEIVDETTFKVTFDKPNGFFALNTAWANNDQTTRCPKHYLSQFHIDYNPKANDLAKSRGFDSWIAMFQQEVGFADDNIFFQNSKRPCLWAWMFTVAPSGTNQQSIAVRNPYYWKVDTDGNQLPYMDRIVYQMVSDPQVLLLKTMQGQIDMMDQYIGTATNKSVLYDNQKQGGYGFYTLKQTNANVMVFMLNLNHSDPVKNKLFTDKNFRIALSLAVDRQQLIDAVLVGQGAPAQPSIVKTDPLWVDVNMPSYKAQLLAQWMAKSAENKTLKVQYVDGGPWMDAQIILLAELANPGANVRMVRLQMPNPPKTESGAPLPKREAGLQVLVKLPDDVSAAAAATAEANLGGRAAAGR